MAPLGPRLVHRDVARILPASSESVEAALDLEQVGDLTIVDSMD